MARGCLQAFLMIQMRGLLVADITVSWKSSRVVETRDYLESTTTGNALFALFYTANFVPPSHGHSSLPALSMAKDKNKGNKNTVEALPTSASRKYLPRYLSINHLPEHYESFYLLKPYSI